MTTAREGAVNVIRINTYNWPANYGYVSDYPSVFNNAFYNVPVGKVALVYVLDYNDNHPFQSGGSIFIGGKIGDLGATNPAGHKAIAEITGPTDKFDTPPDYWVLDEGERVFRQQNNAWNDSHLSLLIFEYNKP